MVLLLLLMQVVQMYISWRDCPVPMISLTSGAAADAGGADVHLVERLSSANDVTD